MAAQGIFAMENATQWSVDQLAASNLAAQLKLDASDDLIETISRHFAEHRRSLVGWAAEQTRFAIIQAVEAASTTFFAQRSEEWIRGFCQAEETIFTLQPRELLDFDPVPPRSKGQILRSMVREARRR